MSVVQFSHWYVKNLFPCGPRQLSAGGITFTEFCVHFTLPGLNESHYTDASGLVPWLRRNEENP